MSNQANTEAGDTCLERERIPGFFEMVQLGVYWGDDGELCREIDA